MLRLTAYRMTKSASSPYAYDIDATLGAFTVTPDDCDLADLDLEPESTSGHIVCVHSRVIACAPTGARCIQIGRSRNNTHTVLDATMSRYAFRIVCVGGAFSIKAGGFDTEGVMSLSGECSALRGGEDYSPASPVLLVSGVKPEAVYTSDCPSLGVLGTASSSSVNPTNMSPRRLSIADACPRQRVSVGDAVVVSIRGWIYSPAGLLLYKRHPLTPGDGILVGSTLFVVTRS